MSSRKYDEQRNSSVFYKEAVFFSTPEVCAFLMDAGFLDLTFKQTLSSTESPEVLDGFGKGAFIAVRGMKPEPKQFS